MKTFSWRDFQILSERLLAASDEAAQRSAISRAYYFAYNVAKHCAEDEGLHVNYGESSHKQIWSYYQSHADHNFRRIGVDGVRLRGLRSKADYELVYGGKVSAEAARAVAEAKELFARLTNLNWRIADPKNL